MPAIVTRGLVSSSGTTPTPPAGASLVPALNSSTSPQDLGRDFQVLGGVNPAFPLISGYTNLGQAMAMRLQTPRGGLWYDQDYGTDLRGWLNAAITGPVQAQLVGAIQSECLKDDRVQACTASVVVDRASSTMTVTINTVTAQGPFSFILAVTSATVAIIESQFNG